jgi:hypothetical protein
MKTPLQATLTTPPGVEYVAVGRGWGAGGLVGRGSGRAPGTAASVAGGGTGSLSVPGCGPRGGGADATGGLGRTATGPWPPVGIVEGEATVAGVVVVVGDVVSCPPDSTSLTTSSWARTRAGRSVTSAATADVAVQTTAVDPRVAASHSPMANNRFRGTPPRMPLLAASEG